MVVPAEACLMLRAHDLVNWPVRLLTRFVAVVVTRMARFAFLTRRAAPLCPRLAALQAVTRKELRDLNHGMFGRHSLKFLLLQHLVQGNNLSGNHARRLEGEPDILLKGPIEHADPLNQEKKGAMSLRVNLDLGERTTWILRVALLPCEKAL